MKFATSGNTNKNNELRFADCIVNQGFLKGNILSLRQSIILFIELNKVLEVANFRFLTLTVN